LFIFYVDGFEALFPKVGGFAALFQKCWFGATFPKGGG
jgi:hypothetical protein